MVRAGDPGRGLHHRLRWNDLVSLAARRHFAGLRSDARVYHRV